MGLALMRLASATLAMTDHFIVEVVARVKVATSWWDDVKSNILRD